MESLVDYVLERGRLDYGEFAPRDTHDPSAALYNHRKLLAYLFQEDGRTDKYSLPHAELPRNGWPNAFPTSRSSRSQGSLTTSQRRSTRS
jgi:hypothetical protein